MSGGLHALLEHPCAQVVESVVFPAVHSCAVHVLHVVVVVVVRSLPLQDLFSRVDLVQVVDRQASFSRLVSVPGLHDGHPACEVGHVAILVTLSLPSHFEEYVGVPQGSGGSTHDPFFSIFPWGQPQVLAVHTLPSRHDPADREQDSIPVLQVGFFLQSLVDCEYVLVPE